MRLGLCSLDTDGKPFGLCWTLSDEVGPTGMRLEQIVCLLPFHVASKPGVRKPELRHNADGVVPLVCVCVTCLGLCSLSEPLR